MIFATGRHGTKLSLILSSHIGRPTSTDHPLEALIGSSFVGVLARVEGSGWLIQTLFFGSLRLLQIRRWNFIRRWWCGWLNKIHSYIFLLIKSRVEILDPTPHTWEEEYFLCFSCRKPNPLLTFHTPTLRFLMPKITSNLTQNWSPFKVGVPWKIRIRIR